EVERKRRLAAVALALTIEDEEDLSYKMARRLFREVDGYYLYALFSEESVRSALNYKPVPGDVFIVSYPKCGTTWLQNIVYNILHGRGAECIKHMPKPGAIKTHMPFRFQPFSADAKYIYICRNPYDCCVSFFHHTKNIYAYQFQDGTFDEFFELFIEGKPDFGDYFDHLLSWYEHRGDPNVFFLTYEDLRKDTRPWMLKIADFIGEEYGRKLKADQRLLEDILKRTSFETMKESNAIINETLMDLKDLSEDEKPVWLKHSAKTMGIEGTNQPMTGDFIRKGAVGDWKNYFSADQIKRLKERIELKTR
ncbi:hypothetical protein HPB47_027150, partial [Ixodes persulcatus]